VIAQAAGCDALVLTQQRVPMTRPIIERLPDLRFISQTGRNTNHLDVPACTEHGIVVSAGGSSGGGSPYSTTAELAWGMILASLRHLPYEVERLKHGQWHATVGTRLFGRTLGVVRLRPYRRRHGARRQSLWHARRVLAAARARRPVPKAEAFEIAASREAFFETADVLSLHLPGNRETRGIITADDLPACSDRAAGQYQSRADYRSRGTGRRAAPGADRDSRRSMCTEEDRWSTPMHPVAADARMPCAPHLGYAMSDSRQLRSPLTTWPLTSCSPSPRGNTINVANPEAVGKR